jgi:hypothetical protein
MTISTQVGILKNIDSNSEQYKAIEARLQESLFIMEIWQPAPERIEEYLDKCSWYDPVHG